MFVTKFPQTCIGIWSLRVGTNGVWKPQKQFRQPANYKAPVHQLWSSINNQNTLDIPNPLEEIGEG